MKNFGYRKGGQAKKQWMAFIVMAFLQCTGCLADYAGIYTGTFSGGDSGTWRMTADSSGALKGFLNSDFQTNAYASTGTVAANGSFRFDAIGSDADFSGVIDGSGGAVGVWTNSYYGTSGTFAGKRVVFGTNSSSIVNPYYPMRVGQQWTYQGLGVASHFTLNVKVDSSETVDGVSCLRANYSINSISRWYAQDADGAVWRLKGQDTGDDYLQMPSSPMIGDEFNLSSLRYRVVSTSALVVVPAGTFIDCIQLECLNHPLGIQQYDYYARGVGWVKSFDLEGGWELTSYSGSEADLIKPTVKIATPAANSRVSNVTCVVSGTATDNRAVTSVWVQVNGGTPTNAVGTTNWTSTVELVAGPNTISVYSQDAANNESVHSNVVCTYVVAGSLTITTNGVGTVTRTPTNSIEIGQTYTLTATSGAGYGFTGWTGDATGTNKVVAVRATSNTVVIANFADNVKPTATITAPVANSRVSNAVCVVSGMASDDKALASVWVQVNNGAWTNASGTTNWTSTGELVAGPNTIRVYSTDAAGNYSAISSVVCTYVVEGSLAITTNGVGTVTRTPTTPVEIGQTYTLTATPGAGYGFVNWTGDVTGVSQVVTVKASSNTSVTATFADNVKPSVTIVTPETNSRLSNATCVVSGTATDDQAVDSIWINLNNGAWTNATGTTNWASTVELVAGPNTIRVYSQDAAGNHSVTASVACAYVLDGSISITTNGVGTVTRTPDTPVEIGQTYTLTATPGVGYGFVNWTGAVTSDNPVVPVTATSNTVVTATFTDNMKPGVTITTPAANARLSNAVCVVSGTATDNQDVVLVQVQVNGVTQTNVVGTTNWISTVELVAGPNTISVYSQDAAGNYSTTASVVCTYVLAGSLTITTNGVGTVTRTPTNSVEIGQTYTLTAAPGVGYRFVNWTGAVTSDNPVVTVTASSNTAVVANFADNVKPGVIIISPAAGSRLSNAVCVVSGTATDDQAVTSVWVQVNGGAWTNAVGTTNWNSTVELVAGSNTIWVYSMDAASNRSAPASVACTYVVAGSLTITTNGVGTVTRTPATPVEIGQTYTLTATSGAGYGFTGWAGDAAGTNPVVTVKATSNTAVTATFTDNVKPSVTITTPAANARLSNAVCVVSGTASDDKALASVWVQVNNGAWTNASGTTNWTSTGELVAGPNTIRVYSMDTAGNYSAVSSVACAYVLDGSISITTNGVGTVTRTPTTPVEIGQTYTLTATPGVGYGFVNWTGAVAGVSQVVTVKASSNTAVVANFADNVKPSVTIVTPETNSRLSNATCVVSGTATDNQDVVLVQIQLNTGTWANASGTTNWTSAVELAAGPNTIRAYSTDATGNNSATVSVTCAYVLEGSLTITTNGLGAVTRTPDTPVEVGQTYTLTATPSNGYRFVNWTGAVTSANPVVSVPATSNTVVTANFADNVKPTVTITTPEANSRQSNATCVVSGTATDNQDVVSVQVQVNNVAQTNVVGTTNWISTVELVAGTNTISVYSQDAASNRSVAASVVCTYVVAASLTITTNGVGTVTRTPDTPVEIGQTYTLTATPGAGYGFVSWVEGSETNFAEVVNLTVTSNTTVMANFADNVKPTVTITTPEANSRQSNATCLVSGTATDDQVLASVLVEVNGGAWTNAVGTTNWTSTVELVAGTNTIKVYGQDAAGNYSTASSVVCTYVVEGSLTITTNGVGTVTRTPDTPVEIGQTYTLTAAPGAGYGLASWSGAATGTNKVVMVTATSNTVVIANFADNVNPTVVITTPETNSRVSNAVCVVSGTATDDQVLASVLVQVNGMMQTNVVGTTNWTSTVELVAGSNTISVYSQDAAGNRSATASVVCTYVVAGSLTITTNGVGTVTRTPDTPVEIGQNYTLTATPGAGYKFVKWAGAVTSDNPVVTVKASSNTSVTATFADNVNPTVTIITPESNARVSNATCVVSGTATDDQVVALVKVQVNNGTWTNAVGTNNWTFTSELVAGLNTIRVYSQDAAGNCSVTASVACTYVVEGRLTITTNGLGTVTRTPTNSVEIGQSYTLTATPGAGYRFVNWTGDVTGVSQVVTVKASSNTSVTATFVDNVKPSVTIMTPETNSRLSNATCVVSGTAADDQAVTSVWVQVNGGTPTNAVGTTNWTSTVELVAGANTIRVYSQDAASNQSIAASVACTYVVEGSLTITTNGLGTVTRTPATPVEIGQIYTLTATPGAGYGLASWAGAATGTNQVVTVKASSNTTVIANFADNVKPTVTILAPSNNLRVSNALCVVSGTATDDRAVTSVWVQVNGGAPTNAVGTTNWASTVELVAGPNTISVYSQDAAGNRSATSNKVCTYVVAGRLSITTNGLGTVTRTPTNSVEVGQTYTLTATPRVGYGFADWMGDITGTNKVMTVKATSNTTVTANFADIAKPTVKITTPVANVRVSNAVCVVSGTATDNLSVASVRVQVNNGVWSNAFGTTNWTSTVELVAGSNTIRVYSIDAATNRSAISSVACTYVILGNLTIQTNGVGRVIRAPAGAPEVNKTYTLTAAAGTGSAFASWTGDNTTTNKVITFVMTSNKTFTANFTDNAKPTVAITAPTALQKVYGTNGDFIVRGTALDNLALSNVTVKVNGGSPLLGSVTTNVWKSWSQPVTLIPGTNTITAYSRDTTGNTSATVTVKCFYIETGTLNITTNGPGKVTVAPTGALELGKTYTLTAAANTGGIFSNWTGDVVIGSPTGKVVKVTLNATNKTVAVTANFTDTAKPTVVITYPANNAKVMTNGLVIIRGTAADNGVLSEVKYQLRTGDWTNAVSTNGLFKTWTADYVPVAGLNTSKVYSVDMQGNSSATSTVVFTYIPGAVLTVETNGNGTITPSFNGKVLQIGSTNTMTATAKTGYVFTNWTYGEGGLVATNTKAIKFVMTSNLVLTANFIVPGGELPFDAVADALTAPQAAIVVDGVTEDWANVQRSSLTKDQDVAAVINGNKVALLLTGCPFGATDTFMVAFKLRLTYGDGDNRHIVDLWTSGSALYGMMDGKAIDGLEAVLVRGVLEVQFPVAGEVPLKVTIEEVGCMMDLGAGMTEVFGVTLSAVN